MPRLAYLLCVYSGVIFNCVSPGGWAWPDWSIVSSLARLVKINGLILLGLGIPFGHVLMCLSKWASSTVLSCWARPIGFSTLSLSLWANRVAAFVVGRSSRPFYWACMWGPYCWAILASLSYRSQPNGPIVSAWCVILLGPLTGCCSGRFSG